VQAFDKNNEFARNSQEQSRKSKFAHGIRMSIKCREDGKELVLIFVAIKQVKKQNQTNGKEFNHFLREKLLVVSGIWDPEKNFSRIRIPGSKKHRIPDPDSQHCWHE
jgi:hypothetical protein